MSSNSNLVSTSPPTQRYGTVQSDEYATIGYNNNSSNIVDDDIHVGSAPKRNIKQKGNEPHTYGSFVAYCFCVNYILGVGVLGKYQLLLN